MAFTPFIARRFLQFQKTSRSHSFLSFVTVISMLGVALGVASLIIALSVLSGFERELKEKVIGFTTHIQVTTFTNQPVRYYHGVEARLRQKVPGVVSAPAFIAKEGMVNFGEVTEGIMIKGLQRYTEGTGVSRYLVEGGTEVGRIDEGLYGCIIGRKLVTVLGASLHDTILVFGLQGHLQTTLSPNVMAFVINGIYESGMAEYDDVYLFTGLPAVQQLINYDDAVSGFEVTLEDIDTAPETAERIMEELGYPFQAKTLFQLYRNLFTWLELQKEPIPLILGLIIAVAAVNVIGTLLMLVLEKRAQIGILRSLGASASSIRRIFLMNGIIIAVVGTAAGNLLGFTVCWVQQHYQILSLPSTIYFMKTVPIHFDARYFAVVSTVSIVLCVAAAYIPARSAARLDPIRSIRLG